MIVVECENAERTVYEDQRAPVRNWSCLSPSVRMRRGRFMKTNMRSWERLLKRCDLHPFPSRKGSHRPAIVSHKNSMSQLLLRGCIQKKKFYILPYTFSCTRRVAAVTVQYGVKPKRDGYNLVTGPGKTRRYGYGRGNAKMTTEESEGMWRSDSE